MQKAMAITALAYPSLHVPPGVFFHLHFFHLPMVLAADIQKSWTNGCGKHTNWLHRERAGSMHEARHSSQCPTSICTAHVPGLRHRAGCWGGRWSLLLWSRLERDQGLSHEDPCLEGSWIGGGEGSRLLCLGGSLEEGRHHKWPAEEVSRMEALL